MDLFHTLILSVVEGITEFLPISSTGHLILVSRILAINQTEFVKSFEIIIQLGAILAVVALYWKDLWNTKIWPQVLAAFLPSAVVGFLLYKFIKEMLIGNSMVVVVALLLGGFAFIAVEYWNKKSEKQIKEISQISYKQAFLIGLFQSVSVIPGVSRAGATILGGLILGTTRETAAKFSFMLAVPTMFAATALDVVKTKLSFSQSELILLLIGFIASFLVALLTVKLFVKYLGSHTFIPFGIYRIVLAIIFFLIYLR